MAEEFKSRFVNTLSELPTPTDHKQSAIESFSMAFDTGDLQAAMHHGMLSSGLSVGEAKERAPQLMQTDLSTIKPMMRQMVISAINDMNVSTGEKERILGSFLQKFDQINTLSDLQAIINTAKLQTAPDTMQE